MTSEADEEPDGRVAKCVVFLNVVFRPIIGVAAAVRGHYDGAFRRCPWLCPWSSLSSFRGRSRRRSVRVGRAMVPDTSKVFGAGVAVVQLTGAVPRYACDVAADWRTCL